MAFREGFEPPTDGLEGRCSIQLSYRNLTAIYIIIYRMKIVKALKENNQKTLVQQREIVTIQHHFLHFQIGNSPF